MITITTPARLDEAPNNNTPAAVENATRVPTTGEPIAADVDGLPVSAARTVDTARDAVNPPRPARALLYVSLASGLVVCRLSRQTDVPVTFDASTERPSLERVQRLHQLFEDPWRTTAENQALAEACAQRLMAVGARHFPRQLVQCLLQSIDTLRGEHAR